jgi:GNAT superfamily N-acetyltransferase
VSYVEPLASHHDRGASFDCGKEPLNRFIQQQAPQNANRHLGVTHVVVEKPGAPRIQGYFTLVTRTVESTEVPAKKKLPRGPIGVILLGRLAVDLKFQGRRLGQRMLLRSMAEVKRAAQKIGIHALVLDTIDEEAKQWYLKLDFGFQEFPENPERLFVPVSFLDQLQLGAITERL